MVIYRLLFKKVNILNCGVAGLLVIKLVPGRFSRPKTGIIAHLKGRS